jgi:hypothetical protein
MNMTLSCVTERSDSPDHSCLAMLVSECSPLYIYMFCPHFNFLVFTVNKVLVLDLLFDSLIHCIQYYIFL